MMKTFAEKYKESIISLSKDDMIRERETIISSIDQKRERLQAVSNDKKMHDIRVSIKKDKIRLREIDYLLRQAHTENSIYHLLDSRISRFMNEFDANINYIVPDWSKFILLSGTAEEVCGSANNGEYGELCVVANAEGRIMWEWNGDNGWCKTIQK